MPGPPRPAQARHSRPRSFSDMTTTSSLAARRVRHELRFRLLEVLRVEQPNPHLRRITLGGPALAGFVSAGFDDHVKLFFPHPGRPSHCCRPPAPMAPSIPKAPPGCPRLYPRRFSDTELEIDFVLHGEGPAATWAAQAAPGQRIGVGGPRGSFIPPEGLDWYLLVGDETALAAIARRLAELPAGTRALVLAEVADASAEQPLPSAAEVSVTWLHRDGAAPGQPEALVAALAGLQLPEGEGYAWVAADPPWPARCAPCCWSGTGWTRRR
ncbi:siderophore-interacting protein [Pseudoroseomonas wenyumeiae]